MENPALVQRISEHKPGIRFGVSEKGAVSVFGLQKSPVTLYREQWTRLLNKAAELREFIRLHDGQLKGKPKKGKRRRRGVRRARVIYTGFETNRRRH